MRRSALLVLLALVAAACGGSSKAPSTVATTAKATKALHRLHVALIGQDHRPRVGAKWHYEVRVTDAATGKPVASRIHLQFLFGGTPVGEVGVHTVRGGVWEETFGTPGRPPFPPASRGQALVLQATVTAKGYARAKARWAVTPR